jgi:Chitobiase/beta-hexosaminidase C-terminal domain/Pectate lyase superfamily protein
MALATYAKQPVGAADGSTLVTPAKRFRKLLQLSPGRLGRCCARSQLLPAAQRYPVLLGGMLIAMTLALVTGCGSSGSVAPPVAIAGSVQGGHEPVSGASVQLYAASSGGLGSASTPLLQKAVATDSNGNFSIPAGYSCPSPSSEVYAVASGGSAANSSGENSAIMLTAMLGPCSGLGALGSVSVNEVTTVGSVWPLAHYFTSPTHLGSAPNDTTFLSAVSSVPEFINLRQGTSPGTPTSTSSFAENNKLYSLADVFAACISSSGGKAGDGSPCGELFSMATSAGGSAPTDTMTAAIQIAQNPDNNVAGIYGLIKDSTAFEPTVTAAPSDWTLTLSYLVATPSISLATGTYTGTQDVTISDATQGSTIYYTTDGTVPTSSSTVYTGPISIAVSSTVEAIAVLTGSSSGVASSTLTITSALTPAKLAVVQQPANALTGATITPAVQVSVEDSSGTVVTTATNPVTLVLAGGTGLGGTLTATPQKGVATFSNLTVSTAGTYTLSASSPSLTSATSAGFTITAPSLPAAAKLAFSVQPSNAATQATITPAVQVSVEDSSGTVVTTATNPITVALAGGTGLGGTLTATPQKGIATFSDLSVSTAGTYTLSASGTSLTPATSTSFTISTTTTNNPPAGTVATPVLSPASGTNFSGTQAVTLSDATPSSTIYYTTNGTTPTTSSTVYTGALSITSTTTVQAIAVASGYAPSSVGSATYTAATGCIDNITSYGAVGNGSTDNTTAINNAFAAAKAAGCSVEIPAGTFNYSNVLVANAIKVFGLGSTSILQATNTADEALELEGASPAVSNLVLLGTGTTRTTAPNSSMVWVNGATNFTIKNILINGGSCTGVWDEGGTTGVEENITVENTLADSLTSTNGASGVTIQNNLVINSGDDGISHNSYQGESVRVNHMIVNQNTVIHNARARGLEASGADTITFSNNYVDDTTGVADMYLSSETGSFSTLPTTNITVTGNTFVHGGSAQGAVLLWSETAGTNTVSNVTLNGNQWYDTTTFTANQIAGAGLLSNILIENSSAYINPVSFYSYQATGSGNSITQNNNTTYATTAYPGPIAPPLAGTVPIFSLPSGTYTLPQTLTLNEPTSGDTMSYCTTASGTCTPTTAYSSSITISAPETVCAIGTNNSSVIAVPSAVVCATYSGGAPNTAVPTRNPRR